MRRLCERGGIGMCIGRHYGIHNIQRCVFCTGADVFMMGVCLRVCVGVCV